MAKNNYKGPVILKNDTKNSTIFIKTLSRNVVITPNFLSLNLEVYNGTKFIKVLITSDMINHKLGEFVPTRKPFSFKKKKHGSKNKF